MIYYLIGQPHAGKTTLSKLLKQHLYPQNIIQIDGDDIRDIFQNKDYSEDGRRKNIQRAQDIAKFLNSKGIDVIISLVSPYRDLRNEKPTENYIDIDTTGVSEFTSLGELITKINEYGNK